MIWNREAYLAHMTFHDTGRELITELFGPLLGLEQEWLQQGATQSQTDLTAFGWDYVQHAGVPCATGAVTGITPVVLEDTPEYTVSTDAMGRRQKLMKRAATIPLPLEYPVKNWDDWLKVRQWYTFREDRVDFERLQELKKLQQQGCLITASIPGGFDEPRQLMGEEELCCAYYEQPELIADMLSTMAETALQVFERVTQVLTIDNLCVHEDMAGKSGPLAGPAQVQQFIKPYYRKIWDPLHRAGTVLFSQDSDGNMNAVLPDFLDCGVNVFYPFEPAAGMDMVAARQKYGTAFAVKGGIDKHVLRQSKEDIRKELEYKLSPAMQHGGVCFALDHRIPNGTPLCSYQYYVQTAREILGLEPYTPGPFIRMAF